MNSVQLVGRLTGDPEIRYSDRGATVARFSLAVERRFKKEGSDGADFLNCVAFGKTAEFLEKWFRKGQRIGLTGRIQTGSYENREGNKVYTTDIIVENVEFVENRAASEASSRQQTPSGAQIDKDGFMNIPDGVDDEDLPFN